MKIAGRDHPLTISQNPQRVSVRIGTTVIADSRRALSLREASYPEVNYIPRAHADMTKLVRTDRVTHCPYKGDATHFSIVTVGQTVENAVWSYETPYPAMQEIAGHLSFYPAKATIEIASED